MKASFIGSAGVPNRYGGFESFVDNCGPLISNQIESVKVTCDSALYDDKSVIYKNLHRVFLPLRSNGLVSIFHDLLAFVVVFNSSSHIIVLGVSGGPWFPFWRLTCDLFGKRLIVNIDGVEWRRKKFGATRRLILKFFDWLAQRFSHVVIYDNDALKFCIYRFAFSKAVMIPYSGDHVYRKDGIQIELGTALTVCRIEPENNIEMLIEGALSSSISRYQIIGNWNSSAYGRSLRLKYQGENRLRLSDPIYDQNILCVLRESCEVYIHGHSVGGTNPSLVEMLFYDCRILCFDVSYNRSTAGNCAIYFTDPISLSAAISEAPALIFLRNEVRIKYAGSAIAKDYIEAMSR